MNTLLNMEQTQAIYRRSLSALAFLLSTADSQLDQHVSKGRVQLRRLNCLRKCLLTLMLSSLLPFALWGQALTTPAPGSILPGSSVTFSWTAGTGVAQYQLWLGSTPSNSGNIGVYSPTTPSVSVTGLPTNGTTVYATLAWYAGGSWYSSSYTYTAAGSSQAAVGAVSCSSASMTGSGTDACTVTLTAAAASGGLSVSLSSSNASVTVPPTVTVPANAASAGFTATVSSVATAQTATLTATGAGIAKSVALQLSASASRLSLATSNSLSTYGGVVTFTATISSGPTGTVTFYDGGSSIGTGTINGTTATLTTSSLIAGSHAITANWPGNGHYCAVTSAALTQVVNKAAPALIWSAPAAIVYGTTLSATQLDASSTVKGAFAYTPVMGTALSVGAHTLSATFTPTDTTDYLTNTITVTLTVSAATPILSIGAASVAFGNVAVGSSLKQSLILTSKGTGSLTISAAAVTGAGFAVSGATLPITLAPGQVATLNVQFDPAVAGAATGQLTINSNSSTNGTALISLSGTGTAGQPALTSPTPGSILPGSSVTFSWTAGTGVTQYQLWLGSTPSNSGNLGVLSPSTPSVSVTGLPTNGATVYATLAWYAGGNWYNSSYTYTAAGSSQAAVGAVSCSSASMTGSGTDACTVTLTAVAASGGLSVSLSSSNASVTVPPTVTVPANATSAGFAATVSSVATAQTATLTATAAGIAKSATVQLNAATSILSVNATSVGFGDVALNTGATQTVTLTSTGTIAVTVNSAAVTGTGFSLAAATFPQVLTPGQTSVLNLQFDPAAAGSATGQLAIASNSSTGGTVVVNLTGTGTASAYAVDLTWNAPTGSTDPVAGYNVYRAPGGTTTYQLINSSEVTQTTYVDSTVQSGQEYNYMVESVDPSGMESQPSNPTLVTVP